MADLKLVTTRPSLTIEIDGKDNRLPILLNRHELANLTKVVGNDGDMQGEDFIEWFGDFAKHYLGDAVDEMGQDAFVQLMTMWQEKNSKLNGIEQGN